MSKSPLNERFSLGRVSSKFDIIPLVLVLLVFAGIFTLSGILFLFTLSFSVFAWATVLSLAFSILAVLAYDKSVIQQ